MFERFAARTVAAVLSGLVTLSIVTALAHTADVQHAQACLAYSTSSAPLQQVVITAHRLPRS